EAVEQLARLSLQRGAWREALTNIDRALTMGPEDPVSLRLSRVAVLNNLNRFADAAAELEALSGEELGPHAGAVELWRGDLLLIQEAGSDKVQARIRRALELGLEDADRAYAEGLLAKTSPQAVDHFQEALGHDPFHHRAHTQLGLMLLFLGRRDEA